MMMMMTTTVPTAADEQQTKDKHDEQEKNKKNKKEEEEEEDEMTEDERNKKNTEKNDDENEEEEELARIFQEEMVRGLASEGQGQEGPGAAGTMTKMMMDGRGVVALLRSALQRRDGDTAGATGRAGSQDETGKCTSASASASGGKAVARLRACIQSWTRGELTLGPANAGRHAPKGATVGGGWDGEGLGGLKIVNGELFTFMDDFDDIKLDDINKFHPNTHAAGNDSGAALRRDIFAGGAGSGGGGDIGRLKKNGSIARVSSGTHRGHAISRPRVPQSNANQSRNKKQKKESAGAGVGGQPTVSANSTIQQLRNLRRELLRVEETVPWAAVAASWADARSTWRRSVTNAMKTFRDVAQYMIEFRRVLIIGDESVTGLDRVEWEREVGDAGCASGGGHGGKLLNLWGQIEEDMALWLDKRLNPRPYGVSIKGAMVEMEAAASCADPDGLDRLPLEVWLGGFGGAGPGKDDENTQLRQLRDMLEKERNVVVRRLNELGLAAFAKENDASARPGAPSSNGVAADVVFPAEDDEDNQTVLDSDSDDFDDD